MKIWMPLILALVAAGWLTVRSEAIVCRTCVMLGQCSNWGATAQVVRCRAEDGAINCKEWDRHRKYCNDGPEDPAIGDMLVLNYNYPGSCNAEQWCY